MKRPRNAANLDMRDLRAAYDAAQQVCLALHQPQLTRTQQSAAWVEACKRTDLAWRALMAAR